MSITKYNIIKTRRDSSGKLIYKTEQSHKDRVDVNNIIKKYARTGVIDHMHFVDPSFQDCTSIDFKTAMDRVLKVQEAFEKIPSNIRNRFDNDPSKFMAFYENPENKEEAKKLGLTRSDWISATPEPEPEPKIET